MSRSPLTLSSLLQLKVPELFDQTIYQKLHNREKLTKEYIKLREDLLLLEFEIALYASPYYLGQVVNFNPLTGRAPHHVIITGIYFIPSEPFYRLRVRNYFPETKLAHGKSWFVDNMATLVGVTKHSETEMQIYEERIKLLIHYKQLDLPKTVALEKVIPSIIKSRELGKKVAKLSPSIFHLLNIEKLGIQP